MACTFFCWISIRNTLHCRLCRMVQYAAFMLISLSSIFFFSFFKKLSVLYFLKRITTLKHFILKETRTATKLIWDILMHKCFVVCLIRVNGFWLKHISYILLSCHLISCVYLQVTWLETDLFTVGLGFLMLSMGLTLTFEDFRRCMRNPWTVRWHAFQIC